MGRCRTRSLFAIFFLIHLSAASTGWTAIVDRIVAVVNGEIIMSSELASAVAQARLGRISSNPILDEENPQDPSTEREVLDQLIDRKLQLQMARKRGITVEADEIQRAMDDVKRKNGITSDAAFQKALQMEHSDLDQYRENLKEQILILKLVNREVRAGVVLGDEEMRAYYDQHPERFLSPAKYHLRQIFLATQNPEQAPIAFQTAQTLVRQLKDGTDFETAVRQHSNGPEAKFGGDLGDLRLEEMRPEIRQVVEQLKPLEISEPIRTAAGVHIVRLDERKTAQRRPYEEVRTEIRDLLFQERSEALYEKWLRDLRQNAQVEIKF